MTRGVRQAVLAMTIVALCLGATRLAKADIIFDNFGDGDTYNTSLGWTIGTPPGQAFYEQGDSFTVTGNSFTLNTLEVAASYVLGPNEYTVLLMTDADGASGDVIEEFSFSDLGPAGTFNPPLFAASKLNPTLDQDTPYWLVYSTNMDTWAVANENTTNDVGIHAFRMNGGDWSVDGNSTHATFRLTGDPN